MSEPRIIRAWKEENADCERDALEMWDRLRSIPPGVDPLERAKQLSALAYIDDKLVGIATVEVLVYRPVRAPFGFYRVLVDPDYRSQGLMAPLVDETWQALSEWSLAHPDAPLAGMGSVRESEELVRTQPSPISPWNNLILAGYSPEGHQIRIRWFDHYQLKT